jgi:simple sugar transport system ATP-binding protein
VLRDGEHVVTDAPANFDRDKIIRAMVGRSLSGGALRRASSRKARAPAGARC